ncbi:MAG: hypothetical protein NWE83_01185 [Candidatus Bathyarchaeota archaeon]|nr:hypothetical protein [Candidatus Bathyarchaeota archaeon]
MPEFSNVADPVCVSHDHGVKSYRIEYEHKDGIMLLSPSTLIFMTATESYEMHYHVHLEVPYHDISQVRRETPQHLVIIDVIGRTYRFTSYNAGTMSKIEADLQRSIGM